MFNNYLIEDAGSRGAGASEVFSLFSRRMNSLGVRGFGVVVISLAVISLTVAVVFSALGAWMILPFAGLETLALYWTYRWVRRHAEDSESLSIREDVVILAVNDAARTRHYEFNRAWATLIVRQHPRDLRLVLRSHGREVEVGRYLDDGGRQRLARELKARLQRGQALNRGSVCGVDGRSGRGCGL